MSDTPVPSYPRRCSPNIFATVPFTNGVTTIVRVAAVQGERVMSVDSVPEHPPGHYDTFVAHFNARLLATIPEGEYVFTAMAADNTCMIVSHPDVCEGEKKAVFLRHRIQRVIVEFARIKREAELEEDARERSAASNLLPGPRPVRAPQLTLLPGGKDDNT